MHSSDESPDPHSPEAADPSSRSKELGPEVLEFLSVIDLYKRRQMRPQLSAKDLFEIMRSLGYERSGSRGVGFPGVYEQALLEYKQAHKKLFPSWSEIFSVLLGIGWKRKAKSGRKTG